MKDTAVKMPNGYRSLLAEATGYTPQYCYMVVIGERSQTSKGGKIIMKKYRELLKIVEK